MTTKCLTISKFKMWSTPAEIGLTPLFIGIHCICSKIFIGTHCICTKMFIGTNCICSKMCFGTHCICSKMFIGTHCICSKMFIGTHCIFSSLYWDTLYFLKFVLGHTVFAPKFVLGHIVFAPKFVLGHTNGFTNEIMLLNGGFWKMWKWYDLWCKETLVEHSSKEGRVRFTIVPFNPFWVTMRKISGWHEIKSTVPLNYSIFRFTGSRE